MMKHFIILCLLLTGFNVYADEPLKVSGFVDAQFQFPHGTANGTMTEAPNTFLINQGALYLSKKASSAEFFLDIPFFATTNSVTTSVSGTSYTGTISGSSTNDFAVGWRQGQAYVKQTYGFGLSWTLGQFDTIYGFELNDTKDVEFASQGIVFAMMPVTHTGLLLQHSFGDIQLSLLASNTKGMGAQPSKAPGEMGLRVGWSKDGMGLGAGVLMNGFEGTYAFGDLISEQLIDVTGGATFGSFRVDLAVDMVSAYKGMKKISATEDAKARTGMLLQLGYKLSDKDNVALRYESVTNPLGGDYTGTTPETFAETGTGTPNENSRTKITLGWKRSVTSELTVKFNVATNSLKASDSATQVNFTDGAIAGVYSF